MCFRKKGSRVLIQGFDSFLSRDVYNPRRARGSHVGSGEKAGRKFSNTGERASGYRISPSYFQKFKRIPAPDWADWALYYCAQSANSFSWVLFVSSYTTAIFSSNKPIDDKSQEVAIGSFGYCVITPRASVITNLLLKVVELIMHNANPLIGNGMEFDVLPLRSC